MSNMQLNTLLDTTYISVPSLLLFPPSLPSPFLLPRQPHLSVSTSYLLVYFPTFPPLFPPSRSNTTILKPIFRSHLHTFQVHYPISPLPSICLPPSSLFLSFPSLLLSFPFLSLPPILLLHSSHSLIEFNNPSPYIPSASLTPPLTGSGVFAIL